MSEKIRSERVRTIYNDFISSFIFWTTKDIKRKANRVFFKVLLGLLIIQAVIAAASYIGTVFFGGNEMGLMEFLTLHAPHNETLISMAIDPVIALLCRQWFMRYQVNNHHSGSLGDCETIKLLRLSEIFPKLEYLVRQRIKDRGFLSKLDYKTLCINRIYDDLELE